MTRKREYITIKAAMNLLGWFDFDHIRYDPNMRMGCVGGREMFFRHKRTTHDGSQTHSLEALSKLLLPLALRESFHKPSYERLGSPVLSDIRYTVSAIRHASWFSKVDLPCGPDRAGMHESFYILCSCEYFGQDGQPIVGAIRK